LSKTLKSAFNNYYSVVNTYRRVKSESQCGSRGLKSDAATGPKSMDEPKPRFTYYGLQPCSIIKRRIMRRCKVVVKTQEDLFGRLVYDDDDDVLPST